MTSPSKKVKAPSKKYLDNLWSKAVKSRAGYMCQICGRTNDLEAHHVIHRRASWEMRWNDCNGVCLCKECHNKADTLEGREQVKIAMGDNYDYIKEVERSRKLKADTLEFWGQTEAEYLETVKYDLARIISCRKEVWK